MQDMPQITIEESSDNYVRVVAEPLEAGFGTTLGNALRRVLLGSLPGAAVTSVRIEQVQHEFSTIPHMKEDTVEFLLNVKELRLRGLSDRPGKLYLEATGPGDVTAGSIETTADYEIVNPDLRLATLDSNDGKLTVEFNVDRGRGYVPADHSNGLPIGVIPVDAIFTPVRRANFRVTHTRVGQMTNYDRLELEVWTDGTITGIEAVSESADIVMNHLALFSRIGRPTPPGAERGLGHGTALPPDRYNTPIEDLNLSVRAYNCLKRSGLMTVGQVLEKTEEELLTLRNFGRKSYEEMVEKLVDHGFLKKDALERVRPNEPLMEEADTVSETGAAPAGRERSAVATMASPDEDDDETIGSLGAALMEALREVGTDPAHIVRDTDDQE